MATQAQLQQANALRKANPNLSIKDSVSQVLAPTTPVTPTPVAATPTPVTPTQIPQTIKGVNGESFQVAPVNPQTGVSQATPTPIQTPTPVTPTPVTPTEVKPVTETPKPVAPIDYNTSVGREADIQKNVTEITKSNPALLKDRNAYNKSFGYDTADQGKKAMLDASFTSLNTPTLVNQKDIVNALVSGISVPEQNTTAYRNAKVVANQFKTFNGMTDVQLLDNLKQGQIGTELDSLLSQNPNYAKAKAELAKIQKTASINRATQIASNVIKGKETPVVDDLANIEAKYNPPLGTNAQAYQDYVVNNPDVISAGSQVKQLSTQISDLTKTYNDALKSIKEQYPDMPASALLTLMGSRTNDTKTLLDSYINAKELAKGDFDLAMKMAEGSYGAYSADIAEANKIASEQRAMDNSLALSQAQFDQKIAQQAQQMQTPELAIPSVIEQYAQLGVMAQKSAQQHIADAKAFISRGGTLGEYISQMQKDFQAKPEYISKFAPKADATPYQIANLGDGKAIMYNQSTGAYNVIGGNGQPVTTQQIPSIVEECRTTGSCGEGVNDYLQKLGDTRVFGNTYSEKQQKINSQEPVVGGIAVWQPTGKMAQPEYGHVGIVTAVNGDKVTVTDWNWNGDNKQTTHTVPLSSIQANGGGFYVPKTQGATTGGFTDSDIAVLGSVAKLDKQGKQTLNENGLTERDWANFNAGLLPPTAKQKQESQVVVDRVDDILKGDWTDAVGPFLGKSRIFTGGGTDRKVTELKVQALKDLLAMANLDKIKGAMSDKDIEFLRNTATYLSTDLSESEFEKTLNEIKTKYANIAGGSPTTGTTQANTTNTGAGQTDSLKIR